MEVLKEVWVWSEQLHRDGYVPISNEYVKIKRKKHKMTCWFHNDKGVILLVLN